VTSLGPVLSAGQYSIGKPGDTGALVYGAGAGGIWIATTETDTGSLTVQDQAVVGHDGVLFGVDTQPGMVITQTGQAWLPGQGPACLDAYSALSAAWNDPTVRLFAGDIQVLRSFYAVSNVTRCTYGRGRKIMPTYGLANQGLVPFTAQFQSADNYWYEDQASVANIRIAPSAIGTLTPPMTPPLQLASQTFFQIAELANTGPVPTWPVITFTGPVTNPGLTYVNTPVTVGYSGTIPAGQSLVIDTRPWARSALLNNVASVAGNMTGDPMISLQLPVGQTLVHFNGQDFTGSATCVVSWQNATLAIGGTL